MRSGAFISAWKWPLLAALAVAVAVTLIPARIAEKPLVSDAREPVAASREAMRMLHEEHDRVLEQIGRQRAQTEQKAAEDAYALDQARLAAAREAERKLAEQRAAEAKRVADAAVAKDSRKPKPEPVVAAGAPLDIVPVTGGDSAPAVEKPRGPIQAMVATVGKIKDKAVETVTGIRDWFSAAGDRLLGREKAVPQPPSSRLSSTSG